MNLFSVNGQVNIFDEQGVLVDTKQINTSFGVEDIAIDQVKNHNNKLAASLLPPAVLAKWKQDVTSTVFKRSGKHSKKVYYAIVDKNNITHLV